ncbi:venom carboxylesterase-6-like [Schistocerca nitens]|uniref:venom carboxylesterase-6-like n=1 Tax=Schistocerca nitens TaxID=7011 RepID=UPI0021194B83|nr:venom carboxylesterase-6-like [Schistocerca nitens]
MCTQPGLMGLLPNATGSEDCLYLNVYVPAAASGPLPVMFYIHGGAFKFGYPFFSNPDYLVEKGVVLVTISYRLGALGFLSLMNDDIPGNAGLKDQVLALQWVQRNIAAFGGDPSKVAIFGGSAGAGSTSHLFLSPVTEGLFSEVIMESGVATAPWALTDKPRERAYRMGEALGFQTQGDNHTDDGDARLSAFLRAANASDLARDDTIALMEFEKRCPLPLAFLPVVEPPSDSAVIVEPPADRQLQPSTHHAGRHLRRRISHTWKLQTADGGGSRRHEGELHGNDRSSAAAAHGGTADSCGGTAGAVLLWGRGLLYGADAVRY